MTLETLTALSLAMGIAAALYAAVGHGGASAYIALMLFAGLAPADVRPTALALNILAAGVAAFRFVRAGQFDGRLFWPIAIAAVPCAYLAGRIDIPEAVYRPLLAATLAAAALRYLLFPQIEADRAPRTPSLPLLGLCGAMLGALAGITGIGGGVYLSPLLIFAGWAEPKRVAGIAALFIVVNSAAGLLGRMSSFAQIPSFAPWLGLAVIGGAVVGTTISLGAFTKRRMIQALGIVMGVAACSLVR